MEEVKKPKGTKVKGKEKNPIQKGILNQALKVF